MTIRIRKWPKAQDYYKKLIDITSEPYPAMSNREVSKEISKLLKNNWLSHRVEAKLIELKETMNEDKHQ